MPSYYIPQSENRDVNPDNLRDGDYVMETVNELLYMIDQIDEHYGEAYCLLMGWSLAEGKQYSWFPIRKLTLVGRASELDFHDAMSAGKDLLSIFRGKI